MTRQMIRLTDRQKQIIAGHICPYCGSTPEYVSSEEIYGRGNSYGMIYLCRPCHAYVGVHGGYSKRALGRLANKPLREAKKRAHLYFDAIWKNNVMSRSQAYADLSDFLFIPREYTHIGMFDVDTCAVVVLFAKTILAKTKYII